MSKSQEEYIRKRFEALEEQGYRRGLEAYGELERNFALAKTEIEKTILYWLRRLAANNNVSTAEARRLLDADELKEFKWSVDEYAEKARYNSDGRWQRELENASAKVHIRLYEAINTSLKNVTNDLMQKNSETIKKGLSEIYENTYYKAGYEIQKEAGRLGTFAAADKRVIEKAIEKPWTTDGKTFSERLWKEQDKLVSAVDSVINKGLMTGSGGDRMIAELADRIVKDMGLEVDKAKKRARTIVRTETSRIHNEASLDSMKETCCEYCKISETLDMTTCEYCGSKDGEVIKVSEAVAGGNVPPLHPNCRGCAIPYFDSQHFKDGSKRAARDPETGKTVLVENMSYKEWKEKFVKPIEKSADSGIIETEEQKILKEKVKNGEITLKLNHTMQKKHMQDTHDEGKSYFTISENELQNIINEKYATGTVRISKSGQIKETISCDKIIGVNLSLKNKEETSTNRFTIHYSKKRTHAVPTRKE